MHAAFDLLNDLLLILAAMNVQPANEYREIRMGSKGLGRVLVPTLLALGVWFVRLAEIALLSAREGARRQTGSDVITLVQLAILWGVALTLSSADFGTPLMNATMSDLAAVLMWWGSLWWIVKPAIRTYVELKYPSVSLRLECAVVCANNGFVIERNNEFMFLMLGETVLQIIVAVNPGQVSPDGADPLFNIPVATAALSFALAVCMMFSFRAMARGQLEGYGRTNKGLAEKADETEGLLNVLTHTQGRPKKAPPHSPPSPPPQETKTATASTPDVEKGEGGGGGGGGAKEEKSAKKVQMGGAEGGSDKPPPKRRQSVAQRVGLVRQGTQSIERTKTRAMNSKLAKKLVDTTAMNVNYESKAIRVLLHMRLYNMLNTLLWEVKALSIMLVGVGVKLAIYAPMASPTAHFALTQRLELGLPLMCCFAVQLIHTLFVKTRHLYSWHAVGEQPMHFVVVGCRWLLILSLGLASFIPVAPLPFLSILAAISIAQVLMLQAHDFRWALSNTQMRPHPMAELPNALLALQNRRKRGADEAAKKAKESLPKQGTPSKMKKEEQTTPAPADGPVRV